ncbi:MAG: metal-dependent hydrolase [Betaproteobacteria bacterium]|nr:metal-dependent hydrolase [Betaproteobacteria bacterium]
MDPVTHALLGAACGFVATRARSRIAALAGAAGALLPDIDVLIGSDSDPLVTLEFHRQFTHSILAAPFGALIVAAAFWFAFKRRHEFLPLFVAAFAGYVSAILLDACTSYGTQLLWPFSDRRFAASIVAVVDPVVTVILLGGVISALRSARATAAGISIGLTVAYLGFGALQRERAMNVIERTAAERGHAIREHAVKPTLGNLVLWRSVYLADGQYVVDAVRVGLFSVPLLYAGGAVRRIEPIDLVPPLTLNGMQAADVVRFARVSDGWLARHPSRPNVIGDIRYSMLPNETRPLWGIEIQPELEEQHVAFHTFRQFTGRDRERFFGMLRGVAPASLAAPEPERQRYKRPQVKNRDAR